MRTYQVTKREGERMGDIDYSFDFRARFNNYCTSKENQDLYCQESINLLIEIESKFKAGENLQVRMYDWWYDLLDVGMYDGWPYWKPTPAVCCLSSLGHGGEWHFWYDITGVRIKK